MLFGPTTGSRISFDPLDIAILDFMDVLELAGVQARFAQRIAAGAEQPAFWSSTLTDSVVSWGTLDEINPVVKAFI